MDNEDRWRYQIKGKVLSPKKASNVKITNPLEEEDQVSKDRVSFTEMLQERKGDLKTSTIISMWQ